MIELDCLKRIHVRRPRRMIGLVVIVVLMVIFIALPKRAVDKRKLTVEPIAGRFVMEAYLGILGKLPSSEEWRELKTELATDGCNRDSLSNVFSGILVRSSARSTLESGDLRMACDILGQPREECKLNAPLVGLSATGRICNGNYTSISPEFGDQARPRKVISAEQLNEALLAVASGTTYTVEPGTVVLVANRGLVVPSGVRLAGPSPVKSKMAPDIVTIMLQNRNTVPFIKVTAGAALTNLQIVGPLCRPGDKCVIPGAIAAEDGSEIRDSRIENSTIYRIPGPAAPVLRVSGNIIVNSSALPVADLSGIVEPMSNDLQVRDNTVLKGDGQTVMLLHNIKVDRANSRSVSNNFVLFTGQRASQPGNGLVVSN